MKPEEIEDLIIRTLDAPLSKEEKMTLEEGLIKFPALRNEQFVHDKIRETILRQKAASFGKSFAEKLISRMENSGVVVEKLIFSFFRKYQLLVAGVIVGLLILNTVFSQQITLDSILGLDNNNVPADEIISFDFNQFINKSDE